MNELAVKINFVSLWVLRFSQYFIEKHWNHCLLLLNWTVACLQNIKRIKFAASLRKRSSKFTKFLYSTFYKSNKKKSLNYSFSWWMLLETYRKKNGAIISMKLCLPLKYENKINPMAVLVRLYFSRWITVPQLVNAFYVITKNEIGEYEISQSKNTVTCSSV